MEQLRQQNDQKINLNRVLGAVNALSESKERKKEDNIIKDIKNLFRLRKGIDNSTNKDIRKLFRLKKETKQSKIN